MWCFINLSFGQSRNNIYKKFVMLNWEYWCGCMGTRKDRKYFHSWTIRCILIKEKKEEESFKLVWTLVCCFYYYKDHKTHNVKYQIWLLFKIHLKNYYIPNEFVSVTLFSSILFLSMLQSEVMKTLSFEVSWNL